MSELLNLRVYYNTPAREKDRTYIHFVEPIVFFQWTNFEVGFSYFLFQWRNWQAELSLCLENDNLENFHLIIVETTDVRESNV